MIYRKKKNFVTREVAGETLIVPLRGKLADMQRIFALDAVAAFIWQNLDGQQDLDRICREKDSELLSRQSYILANHEHMEPSYRHMCMNHICLISHAAIRSALA